VSEVRGLMASLGLGKKEGGRRFGPFVYLGLEL